ncbi:coproporphyrinogen III oxidase family protein [Prosthecochloris sp. SCSIO W1102]|uniref:coproporphyrinogen-III oxidase family protein n=1 Tax=Prosthecochloris sp. SCSIO W1102 TaxID=2992243 RepID=UPI00223CCED7|nr:coproporphyrinogen-III oxidase family protein [Prosthecochloris sp. SCSIO W1102]UZJ39035.1 coproporphyrinogen III oxidase family protein [Prosthecochloris sp. SCSIO W1102]
MTTETKLRELIDSAKYRLDDFAKFRKLGMIPNDGDFFPAGVHYPPITMYPEVTQEKFFESYKPNENKEYDIYVHIPFCRKRCLFCHYPSKYNAKDEEKDKYLDAMEKEIDFYINILGHDKINARTILIGGGTPTDLSPKQLDRFLKYFTTKIDIGKCKQFNYDVDPITLVGSDGIERLKIMRDYGVDRLTIGVQSFDNDILRKMNRSHDSSLAVESIENSKKYDYQTNIEFIFGHPGQNIKNWLDVLNKAIDVDVPEIQFYRLKVIPYGDQVGTIKRMRDYKPDELISNENAILMKEIAISFLAEKGFHENLRRVFTINKKYISKYAFNQCCQLKDEIGLGLTAFSSLNDRFSLNTQSFKEYYEKIEKGKLPINRGIIRNEDEQRRWAIILPLKNYWISKKIYENRTGTPLGKTFEKKFLNLKKYGLITENGGKIELTKTGAFFADEVVTQFSDPQHLPFPETSYADAELNPYKDN